MQYPECPVRANVVHIYSGILFLREREIQAGLENMKYKSRKGYYLGKDNKATGRRAVHEARKGNAR